MTTRPASDVFTSSIFSTGSVSHNARLPSRLYGIFNLDTGFCKRKNRLKNGYGHSAILKSASLEAVETQGTHSYQAERGTRTMSFNRRWDLVQVYMTHEERNCQHSGKSIEQLSQEQGKGIMDAFLDLVLDDEFGPASRSSTETTTPRRRVNNVPFVVDSHFNRSAGH